MEANVMAPRNEQFYINNMPTIYIVFKMGKTWFSYYCNLQGMQTFHSTNNGWVDWKSNCGIFHSSWKPNNVFSSKKRRLWN